MNNIDRHTEELIYKFSMISKDDYYEKVRFYEDNASYVGYLQAEDFIVVHQEYLDALYRLEMYEKHVQESQFLCEYLIKSSDYPFSKELYASVLKRMCLSLYLTNKLDQVKDISSQISGIGQGSEELRSLFALAHLKENKNQLLRFRGIALAMIFLSAGIIVLELIFLRASNSPWISWVEWSRNLIFIAAFMLIFGIETFFKFRARRMARSAIKVSMSNS